MSTVGIEGISKVARGEFYPDYPAIFSDAEARNIDETSITLMLQATTAQRVVKMGTRSIKNHPYLGLVGCGVGAAAAINAPYATATAALISSLGYVFYRQYGHKTIPSTAKSYVPIVYTIEDDKAVQQALVSSDLVDNLDIAFRNYRLNVYEAGQLENKIRTLVLKQKVANSPGKALLSKMDELFEAGRTARENIHGKKITAFIGQTGSGKTTTANWLVGCVMREVDSSFLRRPSGKTGGTVIIAEKSVGDIGHKVGYGSSETFHPQLFTDSQTGLIYCDCPGLGDNRGPETAMCNAQSIVEIIKNSSAVQGFVFFINYIDFMGGRADFTKDIKVLQLLLKNFRTYQNSILFVITKAPPEAEINLFYNFFISVLESINKSEDRELVEFCKQIGQFHQAGTLKQRMIFCNPCAGEKARNEIISKVQHLTLLSNPRGLDLGIPLTPDVFRELDEIKNKIITAASTILSELRETLQSSWEKRISENHTPEGAQRLFDELEAMSSYPITVEFLIQNPQYTQFSSDLRSALTNWDKVNFLHDKKEDLTVRLQRTDELKMVAETLGNLKYECFKSSFKAVMESYNIQRNVNTREISLNLNLVPSDPQDLHVIVRDLMTEAGVAIIYEAQLEDALSKDAFKVQILKNLIKDNVIAPFSHHLRDGRIEVTAHGDKISLHQMVEKIGRASLESAQDLCITSHGTIYFDNDFNGGIFKGKRLEINTNEIEVKRRCIINLFLSVRRSDTVQIKCKLIKGEDSMIGADLVLEPTNITGGMSGIDRSSELTGGRRDSVSVPSMLLQDAVEGRALQQPHWPQSDVIDREVAENFHSHDLQQASVLQNPVSGSVPVPPNIGFLTDHITGISRAISHSW